MQHQRTLLSRLLSESPFQPATSWWRAIELSMVIRHHLPPGAGLDLGCGDGKLMRVLLEASQAEAFLVGVDIDPLETRDAAASGVYRRVHTAPGNCVPEADAAFDFVFSNSVLEHIEELDPVIAEVARVLRPGGVFMFTVPGPGFHDCLAGPLLPWHNRQRYLESIDRRCAHRRYWGEGEWHVCLGRHAIELMQAVSYLSGPEVRRWETLSRLSAGVLYTLLGERLQPIEIQRALRLRRRGVRLPAWAATCLAAAFSVGLDADSSEQFGCLLIEARKRA